MKHYRTNPNISQSAVKAGIDRNTASKYIHGTAGPQEEQSQRQWRTHRDAFCEDWPLIEEMLFREPGLQAKVLFEQLLERAPGKFSRRQRRSFERRVRAWKRRHGAEPELFFSQEHRPAERLQLDWMYCDSLAIEIGEALFEHLLVHVVLPYSNWEWARVCYSESYLSLKRGLQSALVELGGCPLFCQTDQSSTATHVRGRSEQRRSGREYNERYLGLLAHYGLEPALIGVGQPHENGDVETAHGHLRSAIDQALRLRGNRRFASVAQYEGFLFELLNKRNATRGERVEKERQGLRTLPSTRWPEYEEEPVPVSRQALARVGKQSYSVPARYAGERLRVRIWETELEFIWNGELIERTERRRGKPGVFINWRHVIVALLRKPGAFKGWRYREAMFPNLRWRALYDLVCQRYSPGRAEREYLGILALGLEHRLEHLEAVIEQLGTEVNLDAMRRHFCPPNNIVQMNFAVDLQAYDRLLALSGNDLANQEVA